MNFLIDCNSKNSNEYLDVWNLIDDIWHLKPLKFEYMNMWKINQEKKCS